jgi:hypothetical protein
MPRAARDDADTWRRYREMAERFKLLVPGPDRDALEREMRDIEKGLPFDIPQDAPVPAPPRSGKVEPDLLSQIAQTPMASLKFHDFKNLKSGRDEFSRLKLPQLREPFSVADREQVEEAFDDKLAAQCYRWMLRGLPLNKAIRKVRTDLEVSMNAKPQ